MTGGAYLIIPFYGNELSKQKVRGMCKRKMHELYLSNSSRIPNSLQRDLVVEVTVA